MIGTSISHYDIISELGRGGMGVVYKATDTKLNRTVALKFLPPHVVAAEADRVRFRREAQAAAGLSHPNIATVFAIEEAEDQAFIAMEYVDGETLADRIAKGPMKVDDAIDITIQIANGLQAAHEQQIVHRDIKPSNIMITSRGHVKIMDFGLAKVSQASMLTQSGSTLGTVGYMSPEQARGEDVDRRTDIWGLGCVLYQMITGRVPFVGEYEQAIVYSILNVNPEPLTALRTGVPIALDGIIAKILAKDASMRYQHVDELPADLKAVKAGASLQMSRAMPAFSGSMAPAGSGVGSAPTAAMSATRASGMTSWLPWGIAAVALCAVAALVALRPSAPDPEPVRHLSLQLDPATGSFSDMPAISKDGTHIAFVAEASEGASNEIYVRQLDEPAAKLIASVGLAARRTLMLSPDGRWVSWRSGGTTNRASTNGGNAVSLPDTLDRLNAMYLESDASYVLLDIEDAKWTFSRVNDAGLEQFAAFDAPDGNHTVFDPNVSVDGRFILFTYARPGSDGDPMYDVQALDTDDMTLHTLVRGGAKGRLLDNGYLVYFREGDLYATRFDEDAVSVGQSFSVVSGVQGLGGFYVAYDVSANGVLVYAPGGRTEAADARVVFGPSPEDLTPFEAFTLVSRDPRFSPDGNRILVHSLREGNDIWLLDRRIGTFARMTDAPGEDETPFWDPDGRHFYFAGERDGLEYLIRSDASNPSARDTLFSSPYHLHVESVTTDGAAVIISLAKPDRDLYAVDVATGESRELLATPFYEEAGDVSPDNRWIVYTSNDTGRMEVYLNRYPDMNQRTALTSGGGSGPIWSEDGRHVFYFSGQDLVRLPVLNGEPGAPEVLSTLPSQISSGGAHRNYDIRDNGGEFVFMDDGVLASGDLTGLNVITGFTTLVEQLDPERP